MGMLFGKDSPVAEIAPPAPTPPPVMPVPDDKASRDAERRKRARMQSRTGRQSTILANNDNADPLGI